MIGEIIFAAMLISDMYLPADGRCLDYIEYSEVADVLHNNDYWPYGKCSDSSFKLPDLRAKAYNINSSIAYIRVK